MPSNNMGDPEPFSFEELPIGNPNKSLYEKTPNQIIEEARDAFRYYPAPPSSNPFKPEEDKRISGLENLH